MEADKNCIPDSFLCILPELDWRLVDTDNGLRAFVGHEISYVDGKEACKRVFRDEIQLKASVSRKAQLFNKLKLWWKVLCRHGENT